MSAWENVYDTWFTSPNQDLMPVIFVGVGKWRIASVILFVGLILSSVTKNPANSTSISAKWNLSELNTIPLSAQWLMYSTVCLNVVTFCAAGDNGKLWYPFHALRTVFLVYVRVSWLLGQMGMICGVFPSWLHRSAFVNLLCTLEIRPFSVQPPSLNTR